MKQKQKGFVVIDAVVAICLIASILLAGVAALWVARTIIEDTRIRVAGFGYALEVVEMARAIDYEKVGTRSGVPAGIFIAHELLTERGVTYERQVRVIYSDSAFDGVGDDDNDGNILDIKDIHVDVAWNIRGSRETTALSTRLRGK